MHWRGRVWLAALAGLGLFLLLGCPENNGSEDEPGLQPGPEPSIEEVGLRLAPAGLDLSGLSQEEIDHIARGSYLVNGVGGCSGCHTTAAGYLAGGLEFALFPDVQGFTSVIARNLTPDPETGMQLTEDEFIENTRTGKDFTDHTEANPQRLIIHPWQVLRFLSLDDLRAIFAFLRRVPPVRNAIRQTFIPPFPFPPIPFPAIGDGDPVNDPQNVERGLSIPQFFSAGPAADAFNAQLNTTVATLSAPQRARVGRGSYLVNAIADCSTCHTDGNGDGIFDSGLLPGSVQVSTAAYLAGGVDIGSSFGFPVAPLFSRNLTSDVGTGLFLTEEQFIQTLRFGADFRRPGGSLRLEPHFPVEFRLVLDDLQAIFAYLQVIPPVQNDVLIVP